MSANETTPDIATLLSNIYNPEYVKAAPEQYSATDLGISPTDLAYNAGAYKDKMSALNASEVANVNNIDPDKVASDATKNASVLSAGFVDEARGLSQTRTLDQFTKAQALRINPAQDTNFAKQSRYGNLNRKPFNNTLNLSRLADALNNKRHWVARDIGRRTNSGFGTMEGQQSSGERWEPIETQEMRQMRANEALDRQQRQEDIALQSKINAYPYTLQTRTDDITNNLAQQVGMDNISFKRAVQDAVFRANYELPTNAAQTQKVQTYAKYLQAEFGSTIMVNALKLYRESPTAAQLYIQGMGLNTPMLSIESEIAAQELKRALDGVPPEQRMQALVGYKVLLTALQFGNYANAGWQLVGGINPFQGAF